MYGKFPFGATMLQTTVSVPCALTPSGVSTPSKADPAFPPNLGSHCALSEATTSAAVKGVPSLNMTPWRILKVHIDASALGVQLSARTGSSFRALVGHVRDMPARG